MAQTSGSPARSGSGASSIMVIIVVVCLTVFSVLALVTVRSEARLSRKTAEAIVNRYDAEAAAQEAIAQLDELILKSVDAEELAAGVASVAGAAYDAGANKISFTVPMGETNAIFVVLGDIQPGASGQRYTIRSYRQINTGEWHPGGGSAVWPGNE